MEEKLERTLVKAMKRLEVILQAARGKIKWIEAASILRISPRQMRRLKEEYERFGARFLVDKRVGRMAWNRIPLEDVKNLCWLYQKNYFDFNVQHFHEKLVKEYEINFSYTAVKNILQEAGLVNHHKKRGPHRKRRERKPMTGMMLHLDGSTHHWFGESHPKADLLLVMDDANSEIYEAFFVEEEDTLSCLEILRRTVSKKGLFCSLYTDRGSHFFHTKTVGGKVDDETITQVQRALKTLDIQMIPAYSPEARGRGERMWQTFQGRLPQELRLRGISTKEAGNEYLKNVFIPEMNSLFMVEPKEKKTAFMRVPSKTPLALIFSKQCTRVVGNDNIVRFKNRAFQIDESKWRFSFAKCKVTLYESYDGIVRITYGPHIIAEQNLKDFLKIKEETTIQGVELSDSQEEERKIA